MRPDCHTPSPVASFLEEDSNGWLVTFSDLVLQLFAFVLVAAVLGAETISRPMVAETALPRPQLEIPTTSLDRVAAPDALSMARLDEPPRLVTVPVATESLPDPARTVHAETPPSTFVEAPVEPAPATSLAREIQAFVLAEGLEESVQVAVVGGGIMLSISDTIGFASGSAELLPDAAPVLAKVRTLVRARTDLVVEVAGHSDDRPVHGLFRSNLDLSLARAARVAHLLAAGDPELAARIFAAGYGAQHPLASNLEADGRARNRRVELRLVPRQERSLDVALVDGG